MTDIYEETAEVLRRYGMGILLELDVSEFPADLIPDGPPELVEAVFKLLAWREAARTNDTARVGLMQIIPATFEAYREERP